jgi:hypothetical protein
MTINTAAISPKETFEALAELAKTWRLPAMLHGAPGIGKTSLIEQLADKIVGDYVDAMVAKGQIAAEKRDETFAFERARRLRDVRLTTIESVDLRGLPVLDHQTKQSKFYAPEFLPTFEGPGILFFDEITAAERRLQASAYSILQERRIGAYELPDGWFVVAAGNGAEHGAISHEMGSALADRLIHFKVTATPKAWLAWAGENDIAPEVMAFIQCRQDYLEGCETRVKDDQLIGPSPRGWHRVSTIIKAIKNKDVLRNVIPGIIGEVAAAEFFLVLEELDSMVKVESLLKAKPEDRAKMLPKTIAGLYGVAYALIPSLAEKDSIEPVFETFEAMRSLEVPGVPTYEIAVLGMELVFDKGDKMGMIGEMAASPCYKRYAKERKQMGLQ